MWASFYFAESNHNKAFIVWEILFKKESKLRVEFQETASLIEGIGIDQKAR